MNDEYFLNQWFYRSLKSSRKSYCFAFFSSMTYWKQEPKLDIDKSLFPINLQSSQCWFLPWNVSRHLSDYEYEYCFEHFYSLSLFDSSHSFSFWLFLPHQCELNIQIASFNVKSLVIVLCADEKYHSNNGNSVSIDDRWIYIVLTKSNLQSNYKILIDGEYISNVSQYPKSFNEIEELRLSSISIVIFHKFAKNSLELLNQARLADFNGFKRCLTVVEIRAIHQQQTSIEKTKVGTYINNSRP
jgi:hypothetical protein